MLRLILLCLTAALWVSGAMLVSEVTLSAVGDPGFEEECSDGGTTSASCGVSVSVTRPELGQMGPAYVGLFGRADAGHGTVGASINYSTDALIYPIRGVRLQGFALGRAVDSLYVSGSSGPGILTVALTRGPYGLGDIEWGLNGVQSETVEIPFTFGSPVLLDLMFRQALDIADPDRLPEPLLGGFVTMGAMAVESLVDGERIPLSDFGYHSESGSTYPLEGGTYIPEPGTGLLVATVLVLASGIRSLSGSRLCKPLRTQDHASGFRSFQESASARRLFRSRGLCWRALRVR